MGKASRKQGSRRGAPLANRPAAYVARPFEGLPSETDWVALREILPAATATVTLSATAASAGLPQSFVLATVLPMAWPALHRADGLVMVSTQSGPVSGDASRDLVMSLLAASAAPEGEAVPVVASATAETPRLQDLLAEGAGFELTVHDGFDFWVAEANLDDAARESLQAANESVIPTVVLGSRPSAYLQRIGERSYLRWVLPHDEEVLLDALARLHAAGDDRLVEGGRLIGMFRTHGLLVPVWDLPRGTGPDAVEDPLSDLADALARALSETAALSTEERSVRDGLATRQVTIR